MNHQKDGWKNLYNKIPFEIYIARLILIYPEVAIEGLNMNNFMDLSSNFKRKLILLLQFSVKFSGIPILPLTKLFIMRYDKFQLLFYRFGQVVAK